MRQDVLFDAVKVPLQGPAQCGPYAAANVSGLAPEEIIAQLGEKLDARYGVEIQDLAEAVDAFSQTKGRFELYQGDPGAVSVQSGQEVTSDGPVVAHFPVYSAYEADIQIDGHFMVVEDVTAGGRVRLLDNDTGEVFTVSLVEFDAAWSRMYIGAKGP